MKYFKKGVCLGLGFVSVVGVAFAAGVIFSVNSPSNSIPPKGANDTVSFNEFNQLLGTVKNIYNDNDNKRIGIGSGASNPQTALDVAGNITIRGIHSCPKLGTTAAGRIVCHY